MKEEAIKTWNEQFENVDTVWVTTRSVSRSGMSRKLSLYVVQEGELVNVTSLVSRITGMKMSKEWELIVKGCGMDMHFHVVYGLSRELGKDLKRRSF